MALFDKPAHALHDLLTKREISATELLRDVLDRLDAVEKDVQAYLTVLPEAALAQATAVDKKIADGEEIAFFEGIPGAIKDNICTKGIRTTCASKILENFGTQGGAHGRRGDDAAGGGVAGHRRQDEYGRIRYGRLHGEFRFPSHA